MGEISATSILILLSCMMTIIFGGYMITKNEPQGVGIIVGGLGVITTGMVLYYMVKPSGKVCDKCNGSGELEKEHKMCSTCGRELKC